MKKDGVAGLAAGLGAIAGMRTMAAPAVMGELLKKYPGQPDNKLLEIAGSKAFTRTTEALTGVEMVNDKTRFAPDRITPVAYAARVIVGAISGGAAYKFYNRNVVTGAIIGGIAAGLSTYVTFKLRKAIDENTSVSDKVLGLVEDGLVIGSGKLLINNR